MWLQLLVEYERKTFLVFCNNFIAANQVFSMWLEESCFFNLVITFFFLCLKVMIQ